MIDEPPELTHDSQARAHGDPAGSGRFDGLIPDTGAEDAALGEQLYRAGDHTRAEVHLRRALEAREALGVQDLAVAELLLLLAGVFRARGQLAESEPLLERALAIGEWTLGRDDPGIAPALNALAHLHFARREYERAEPLLRRLLVIQESQGPDHPAVAGVLASLATVHEHAGRLASAHELWRRTLASRERTLPADSPAIAVALEHLAETYVALGQPAEAVPLLERSLGIRERAFGGGHRSAAETRMRLLQVRAKTEAGIGTVARPAPVTPPAARPPVARPPVAPPPALRPPVAAPAGNHAPATPAPALLEAHRATFGEIAAAVPAPSAARIHQTFDLLEDEEVEREHEHADHDHPSARVPRFDPLGDTHWPKTRLVLGAAVAIVAMALGLAVVTRDREPARPPAAVVGVEGASRTTAPRDRGPTASKSNGDGVVRATQGGAIDERAAEAAERAKHQRPARQR
ncbi:MAG TPA: tetratricopeptide repeat protein [Gemmatimonadaceae bacterium]|nr:tetratricopeptide repeat protein [Gemmatimonadaceae bacterium]